MGLPDSTARLFGQILLLSVPSSAQQLDYRRPLEHSKDAVYKNQNKTKVVSNITLKVKSLIIIMAPVLDAYFSAGC